MQTIFKATLVGLLLGLMPVSALRAAPTLADVIIVVDNSASMADEAAQIQNGLAGFAASIESQIIDLQLILISDDTICVPAPLGSGACPADENLPGYRRVDQTVGSNDALQTILNTYDQWSASTRPGASKSIVVVSDDDSDLSAVVFDNALQGLDSSFANYRFHAIIADFVSPLDPCQSIAAARGVEYLDLAAAKGGLVNNLCEQSIDVGLVGVAQAVIADTGPGTPGPSPDHCEIELDKTSYVTGETVTAVVFRLANLGSEPLTVDLRNWISVPPGIEAAFIDVDDLTLPAGFDFDFGPLPLFTVAAEFPRGSWEYGCRMLSPISGAEVFLDLNPLKLE